MSISEDQQRNGRAGDETGIPMVVADVALITRTEFTVHVQLAASMPDGSARPGAVVSMSEAFARSLCAHLLHALDGGAVTVPERA